MRKNLAARLRRIAEWLDPQQLVSGPFRTGRRSIYVFFDEAGDLDFGGTGTRFYLCGALVLTDPWPLTGELNSLRESIYRGGFIKSKFHASEDLQETRNKVFDCIVRCGAFEYHVVVIEKQSMPPLHHDPSVFYTTIADLTLRTTLNAYPTAEPIYVITDRLPVQRKREAVIKGFQNCLSGVAEERSYEIGHHASEAHPCLQAADYINWAIFRKWERADHRAYELIKNFVRQEVNFDGRLLGPPKK